MLTRTARGVGVLASVMMRILVPGVTLWSSAVPSHPMGVSAATKEPFEPPHKVLRSYPSLLGVFCKGRVGHDLIGLPPRLEGSVPPNPSYGVGYGDRKVPAQAGGTSLRISRWVDGRKRHGYQWDCLRGLDR